VRVAGEVALSGVLVEFVALCRGASHFLKSLQLYRVVIDIACLPDLHFLSVVVEYDWCDLGTRRDVSNIYKCSLQL
jgi:hypothetical protein